jgi:hypothetical protein
VERQSHQKSGRAANHGGKVLFELSKKEIILGMFSGNEVGEVGDCFFFY